MENNLNHPNGSLVFHKAVEIEIPDESSEGTWLWIEAMESTYLSISSQPGGSMSSFGAMALGGARGMLEGTNNGAGKSKDPHKNKRQPGELNPPYRRVRMIKTGSPRSQSGDSYPQSNWNKHCGPRAAIGVGVRVADHWSLGSAVDKITFCSPPFAPSRP